MYVSLLITVSPKCNCIKTTGILSYMFTCFCFLTMSLKNKRVSKSEVVLFSFLIAVINRLLVQYILLEENSPPCACTVGYNYKLHVFLLKNNLLFQSQRHTGIELFHSQLP